MSFLQNLDNELKGILSGEFSEPATLIDGSSYFQFDGIFDLQSVDIDINSGATILANNPQIGCHLGAINLFLGRELNEDDHVIIVVRDKEYRVKKINPDGTGYATIILKN
jgi:hypothetical protein